MIRFTVTVPFSVVIVALIVCNHSVVSFSIPRSLKRTIYHLPSSHRIIVEQQQMFTSSSSGGSTIEPTKDDSSTNLNDLKSWVPMSELRETTDIASLVRSDPTRDSPRLAKDDAYATSVIHSWKNQLLKSSSLSSSSMAEPLGSPFIYTRNYDGEPLGGYLVIPSALHPNTENEGGSVKSSDATTTTKAVVPAIVLFHTGAGPQDIFLRWQADRLVRELGCVVLIADLMSDLEGWVWLDRNRYAKERTSLLEYGPQETNGLMGRWKLQGAINSALDAVRNIQQVDEGRIAALGWCFGGQTILELSRMNCTGVVGVASYHGVFDGILQQPSSVPNIDTNPTPIADVKQQQDDIRMEPDANGDNCKQNHPRALICNGNADPYVKPDDFQAALDTFKQSTFALDVLEFEGTRHGFTNPYQDINLDENFAYSEEAATASWDSTIELLHDVFIDKYD